MIEDIDEVASDGGEDEPEPAREVPVREEVDAVSLEAAAVADEPVSERDALKLVRAADRELARAIEQCVGRADLVAELQRARIRVAAGVREIEQAWVEKPVVVVSGKRRGRPANLQENARRAAVLGRVQAGEISNAEAAEELGISYAAWSGWKTMCAKRAGVTPAPIASASVEPTSIPTEKRGRGRPVEPARLAMLERVQRGELGPDEAAAELGIKLTAWNSWMTYHSKRQGDPAVAPRTTADLDLESFGRKLRHRLRDLLALVEMWVG